LKYQFRFSVRGLNNKINKFPNVKRLLPFYDDFKNRSKIATDIISENKNVFEQSTTRMHNEAKKAAIK
jgi:hypothetical protein